MPSPVMGSVAAAASPTHSTRPAVSGTSSTRAGIGHAWWRSSGRASGPSTSAMWGRAKRSGHRAFISLVATLPPRWIPKPTLARPSGSGNDHT